MKKLVNKNRRAFYDYEIGDRYEAGMSLFGSEIKSIREGRVTLRGSFISIQGGEAFWKSGLIQPWEHMKQGTGHEDRRDRKLLLHKKELKKIIKAMDERGATIVPLALVLVRGRAKLQIAIAKGKKQYDKRHDLKEKDVKRRELAGSIRL
ncbi:TPA: SsrA-binding protein SmpB [Candidatus Peregrinibacteria bacterium]|nr:SsrA-binding protein SmpB [Candidatus Peregrinibacteria bacterium]HIQ57811.1 SsrA-binding protein SmpB [Candidatus Gracilibacteria bacterium]